MEHIDGLHYKTIVNVDWPESASEKASCKSDIMEVFDWIRKNPHQIKVVYFDSIMRWNWKLLMYLKDTVTNAKGARDLMRAYGVFGAKMKMFLDTIASLTDVSVNPYPVHFIATWGTGMDIDEETGRRMELPVVDGKMVPPIINFHWDDVLRLEKDDAGKYLMYTSGRGRFDAKVSCGDKRIREGIKDVIENPNLYQYLQMFNGGD